MKLVTQFVFSSAHFLPNYVGKCKQMHGHNYNLEVIINGEPNPDTGMIVDYFDIEYLVKGKILPKLDYHCLNDVMVNPTLENVATYILIEIQKHIPAFKIGIRLYETDTGYVEVGEC